MAVFLLFLVLSFSISCYEIDARSNSQLGRQHSVTRSQDINSILLTVDNEFDCIDIYKQPAFEHPLLKNHKIQLNPTFARDTMQRRLPYTGKALKVDNFTEGCPPGKVPIHKARRQIRTNSSSKLEIEDFHPYSQSHPGHHFATLDTTLNTTYHGASARFGLYNLSILPKQYNISQIWLQSGPSAELNSIQFGWGIHPSLFGDYKTRLTTYWTADNYQKTGCFNYLCPGFVQVDPSHPLGGFTDPLNVIGSSKKVNIGIKVKQDQSTGHWWLIVSDDSQDNIHVGYWPKEIFTHLGGGSSFIRYGGETFAPPNMRSPPMGSGELPQMLFHNSAFMAQVQIVDAKYKENYINPDEMKPFRDTNTNCYDLLYRGDVGPYYRQAFLFGGPGGECGI